MNETAQPIPSPPPGVPPGHQDLPPPPRWFIPLPDNDEFEAKRCQELQTVFDEPDYVDYLKERHPRIRFNWVTLKNLERRMLGPIDMKLYSPTSRWQDLVEGSNEMMIRSN